MEHEIFNHRHFRDYTIIPNQIVQADDLSFFAKGLLCYLLSLPDTWKVKAGYIADHFGETEPKILRGLKELIDAGYCKRSSWRGEHGRMIGQRYQITDIKGDFTDPLIFGGTVSSTDPVISPTTVETDPRENTGSDINKIYNNKINISCKESKEKAHKSPCLFINSPVGTLEAFVAALSADPNYAGADFHYYFEVIKNWSDSEGKMKKDWVATAKNWMMRDYKDGKLVRIKPQGGDVLSEGAKRYLQMGLNLDGDELWPGL